MSTRQASLPGGVAVLVAVLVFASVGCSTSTPRHVQAIDSSQDRVKFLYHEETAGGQFERGVIECEIGEEDREFEECRYLDVEYGR